MATLPLRLKNALNSGHTAMATFMLLKGVRAAQVIAHLGFDAVIVDCEHGNAGDSDMHDMVAIIAASGVSPVVRVPGMDMPVLKRTLDTGSHGIIVPMISCAADAKSVVSRSQFPPLGQRGQGSPFACFSQGLATPHEYVSRANDDVLIMIQIETAAAVDNIEEICKVAGIDLLLIGPNDLALSLLGYCPPKWTEPSFLEAIEKIKHAARVHGKKCGLVVVDGQTAHDARQDFDFVVMTADVRALQAWYREQLIIARL